MNPYIRDINKENDKEIEKEKKPFNDPTTTAKIINYLNEKAHKQFTPKSTSVQDMIKDRITEGYYLEDFYKVIDFKVLEWMNDPKMNRYLRPKTLFSEVNFANYLNEALYSTATVTNPIIPVVVDFNDGENNDWYESI